MKKILCGIIVYAIVLNIALLGVCAVPAPDAVYGDVNCDRKVDVTDATYLQQNLVGLTELTKLGYELADFNGDNRVSIEDATMIQMYKAKLIKHIPREPYALYTHVSINGLSGDFESGKAIVGVPVTFTATADIPYGEDKVYPIRYEYIIKTESSIIARSEISEEAEFTYTFLNDGIYTVELRAYNSFDGYSAYEIEYEVLKEHDDDLMVSAVNSEKFGFEEGEDRVFTAYAYGGLAPYQYRFFSDGLPVQDEFSDSNTLTLEPLYKLDRHETHTVTVEVKDGTGNIVSDTCEYMVYANLP